MSDHEGFEMLDDTFGVRSESESSAPNSPQPALASSPSLQLQPSSLSNDVLQLGRVGMGTGDGISQKTMRHVPSDSTMAVSPQQTGKGCGNVPEDAARLKSGEDAGWDRFRPTDRATDQKSLADLSGSKDPRSRSPAKAKRDEGGGEKSSVICSAINAEAGRPDRVGVSPSSSTKRGSCLCTPTDNTAVGQNNFPSASTAATEEFTGTPGGTPVGGGLDPYQPLPTVRGGGHEQMHEGSPLPPVPPTAPAAPATTAAPAAPARFGTFPAALTAARVLPPSHFPVVPPAAPDTPFDPRADGMAAPLPLPVGTQEQQWGSSFGVTGAAATSIDVPFLTTSREPTSSAASDSAEDEAAVVELVGMGFDREHVVRALQECGRGESWKEAAISLLLEPQTSMVPDSGPSGGGLHEVAEQG